MFKGKGKNKGCKGKGKGKGGKLSPQERAESRIDPEDQGNMPNHVLPLSRDLASVLRYPQNYGLDNDVDDDGWVYLVKVLPLPFFGIWGLQESGLPIGELLIKLATVGERPTQRGPCT